VCFPDRKPPEAGQRNGTPREMIVIAPCAILCGAESWVDVAEWGEDNEA
jgi:hypothetical protein